MEKLISQTVNGRVFVCPNCDKIHVEFHNFLFSFSNGEYHYFKQCFARMDGCYYESINSDIVYSRKIIVPIGHKNASMMLNRYELIELQKLLNGTSVKQHPSFFLSVKEIGFEQGAN